MVYLFLNVFADSRNNITMNETRAKLLFPYGDAAATIVVVIVEKRRYNGAFEHSHSEEDCRARKLLLVEVDVIVVVPAAIVICKQLCKSIRHHRQ